MSDVIRNGSTPNRQVIRTIKACGGNGILLAYPLGLKPRNNYLRGFLHALGMMSLKSAPPGYGKFLPGLGSSLSKGRSPVFVLTNSSMRVPFWIISLKSKRDFILVNHKRGGDREPVLSELARRYGWSSFARTLKGLGVKRMVVCGEINPSYAKTARSILFRYFEAGIDSGNVFPS